MTENRLELLDADLSARLEKASISQLRNAAKIAGRFALDRANLSHPILDRTLEAIELGNSGDSSLKLQLESFVNTLDEVQWDLQEKLDEDSAKLSTYQAAFRRARAANSVYFALNAEAFTAATEAIYEAHAATDDLITLKEEILIELDSDRAKIAALSPQITSL